MISLPKDIDFRDLEKAFYHDPVVKIRGIGKFTCYLTSARHTIPAGMGISFKPSPSLKKRIRENIQLS